MNKCPYCGAQLADDSRFCTECGKEYPQGIFCPHCGVSVNVGDAYCYNCGKSLKEAPIEEPALYDDEEEEKSGFKKYLPYIIGAFALLALIGYFNSNDSNDSSSPNNNEVQATDSIVKNIEVKKLDSGADYTEKDIKNSLESMYKEIFDTNANEDYDIKYTSTDYQSLLNKAYKVADDEVIIDADHWIQGQDCDKPSMSVVSVKKESDTKAIAKINIKQFQGSDNQSLVRLILLFENGKWVVDDFISLGDGGEEYSEKLYLKKYIEDCQSKPREDYSWLQGHWVYRQNNYEAHLIIKDITVTQYSTLNPTPEVFTYRVDGNQMYVKPIKNDGTDFVATLDIENHRIDYGNGNWMHKLNN